MTFTRRRLTKKGREALWLSESDAAREAGRGDFPICNLCNRAVIPGRDLWDESHDPAKPNAWGGTAVGIAHRRCNRIHGATVVTPMVAKAKRQWRRNVGIAEPGVTLNPIPGGRDDRLKKKLNGEVVQRAER
jgi:hypothetical protein